MFHHFRLSAIVLSLLLAMPLAASCGKPQASSDEVHAEAGAAAEFERGPHNGRLLKDGDFALEVTIFERGVPPEFRVYAYQDGAVLAPEEVRLTIELRRFGGRVDTIGFAPREDYLLGDRTVEEPHSFDVVVVAVHEGTTHRWEYASPEGRTTKSPQPTSGTSLRMRMMRSVQFKRD